MDIDAVIERVKTFNCAIRSKLKLVWYVDVDLKKNQAKP